MSGCVSQDMQGVVLDIFRCSMHDGPGIRTTVFLKGCPLTCLWCHNPESQGLRPVLMFNTEACAMCGACGRVCAKGCHRFEEGKHVVDRTNCEACGKCVAVCCSNALEIRGKSMSVAEVMEEVRKDMDYYRDSEGGVTLSGGEPMLQFEFAYAIASEAKKLGIHTVMETCGIASAERYRAMLGVIDLFLYDYKGTDGELHKAHTGVGNELILKNLEMLYEAGAKIHLRCPMVPGVNDTAEHLAAIAKMRERYPKLEAVEIMPYHGMGNEKARRAGLEVRLDLPDADEGVKEGWRKRVGKDVIL